ncbi:hypothetical protein OG470_20470 [Micromonospora sp. NBC_00389]
MLSAKTCRAGQTAPPRSRSAADHAAAGSYALGFQKNAPEVNSAIFDASAWFIGLAVTPTRCCSTPGARPTYGPSSSRSAT